MLPSSAGIGDLVTLDRTILDSPRVHTTVLAVLVLSVAYDMLAHALERRLVSWLSVGRRKQGTAAREREERPSVVAAATARTRRRHVHPIV